MWKYTHTDEMYHSLVNGNSNELYHSEVYLGQDYSDGIRHFKYIKREMVNGRWKYYYKDAEYDKAYNKMDKIDRQHTANAFRYAATKINTNNSAKAATQNGKISKAERADYINSSIKEQNAKEAYEASSKKWDKQKKSYTKTAIKTAPRRLVGNAAVGVANAASDAGYNIKKSVKKGKKAINKYLKKYKKK